MAKHTLYKQDATGKIREWSAWIEPTESGHQVLIRHGLMGGNCQFEKLPFFQLEDAQAELATRVNKKRDRLGYTTEIPSVRPFRPLLATPYEPERTPAHVYVQPKLDGFRCLGSCMWMMSRTGSFLHIFKHILAYLAFLPEDLILDGELYSHADEFAPTTSSPTGAGPGRLTRFQQLTPHLTPDRPTTKTPLIEYHVYDIVDTTLPFVERLTTLQTLDFPTKLPCPICNPLQKDEAGWTHASPTASNPHCYFCAGKNEIPCPIKFVPTTGINSGRINEFQKVYLKQGYEGLMIRAPHGMYEYGLRSSSLMKYKRFDQDNYQIVDIICGKGRFKNQAVMVCITKSGQRFQCSLAMPEYVRVNILIKRTQYIDKYLTVEYPELTQSGVPRNPVGKAILV